MNQAKLQQIALRALLIFVPHVAGWIFVQQLVWPSGGPTLIWPPAGIAFAGLLLFGVGYWPVIALSSLFVELLWGDMPGLYLPLAIAGPTLGAVVGVWVCRRLSGGEASVGHRVVDSGRMLIGAAALALFSGCLGSIGLTMAGANHWTEIPKAWALWSLGDLFGMIVCTPAVLRIYQMVTARTLSPLAAPYSGNWEKLWWGILLVLSSWLLMTLGRGGSSPIQGLVFLPLALLAWSAVRLEPVFTAAGVAVLGLGVAVLSSLGLAGFDTPHTLTDSAVVALFVGVLAILPQMLSALEYERRVLIQRLEQAARQDDVTGLLNRSGFHRSLDMVLAESARSGEHFALAHVDLDQFKLINDSCGTSQGDVFLAQLGSVLQAGLAQSDHLARIGGDEFSVLWRNIERDQAELRAEDMLRTVDSFRFPHAGRVLSLSASVGLVCVDRPGQSAVQILREASAAALTAKEHGGNRVKQVLGVDLEVRQRQAAMQWAVRLSEALEKDRFKIYAQRIFPLGPAANDGICIEVLLRMEDPEAGLLLPGRFIPAAERYGQAARLDRYVLKRVLSWFDVHREARERLAKLCVNLSAASLSDEELLPFMRRLLDETGFPPGKLCLEITETDAIRDLARTRTLMEGLRALGVCFALDDFGSGFCSFGYLRTLPVDSVKIDGSFVRDLADDPSDRAIVRAIVEVAKSLGKQTVAECVESEAARAMVAALEVDFAQGYALHRPEPLESCMDIQRLATEVSGRSTQAGHRVRDRGG